VLCFDEFGPLEVKPVAGANWRLKGKPDRIPATYHRDKGVQHLFAAYDMKEDKLYAHMKPRKRWREYISFLRYLRDRFRGERLYLIQDNYSSHKKDEVMEYTAENNVEMVFLPTNASWLNRIECEFTAVRKFALENSNYQTKKEQASALRRYIIWRNRHPKDQKLVEIKRRNQVG
jgi:transposase